MFSKNKDTVANLLSTDEHNDEIKQLVKFVVPRNTFCKKECQSILKFPYKDVETFKELYSEGKILDLIVQMIGVDIKTILKQEYQDFIYFISYINQELENLGKLEASLNEMDEDDLELYEDMKSAGAERLNMFKSLNTIDAISGGDILKWEIVEKLPYEQIYAKLLMNKTQASIQRKYQKIITERLKTKK